jgi:hypothetical protein
VNAEEQHVRAGYYGHALQACDEFVERMRGHERRDDRWTDDEDLEEARAEFRARLLEAVLRSKPL